MAGGSQNKATGFVSTIGGGSDNVASGAGTTVVGGANNVASGDESVVAGGNTNSATGFSATVAGGGHNVASGSVSFVAGRFGKASGNGTFVWADRQPNANVFEVAEGSRRRRQRDEIGLLRHKRECQCVGRLQWRL